MTYTPPGQYLSYFLVGGEILHIGASDDTSSAQGSTYRPTAVAESALLTRTRTPTFRPGQTEWRSAQYNNVSTAGGIDVPVHGFLHSKFGRKLLLL